MVSSVTLNSWISAVLFNRSWIILIYRVTIYTLQYYFLLYFWEASQSNPVFLGSMLSIAQWYPNVSIKLDDYLNAKFIAAEALKNQAYSNVLSILSVSCGRWNFVYVQQITKKLLAPINNVLKKIFLFWSFTERSITIINVLDSSRVHSIFRQWNWVNFIVMLRRSDMFDVQVVDGCIGRTVLAIHSVTILWWCRGIWVVCSKLSYPRHPSIGMAARMQAMAPLG